MSTQVFSSGVTADLVDVTQPSEKPEHLAVYSAAGATIKVRCVATGNRPLPADGSNEAVTLAVPIGAASVAYLNRASHPNETPVGLPPNTDGLIVEVTAGTIYFNGAGSDDPSQNSGLDTKYVEPTVDSHMATVGDVIYWGRVTP